MILLNYQLIFACSFFDRSVLQRMDIYKINSTKNTKALFLKEYVKLNRQERYYIYERDRGRLVKFDETYFADENADVIKVISKEHLHKALNCALKELTALEQQIIDDCFFNDKDKDGNRKTYTELAKKYNISRQAYAKRLNKILKKLRVLIDFYYEDF